MGEVRKEELRIFVGYDSSEERAFNVCAKSILRRASQPVQIYPLRQDWLRSLGIYWRERDPNASTEFAFTRLLVPALCGYHGPALFVDADFLFLADVAELFALYDNRYGVQVVQHDVQPTDATKMGGVIQTTNPRKWWSSLMLMNTGHPYVHANLTPHEVNTRSGAYLHRLEWCPDHMIGALSPEWNYLVGYTQGVEPRALHFTNGIRAIHGTESEFDALWEAEEKA